jgi:hypothetical protein
MRRMFLGFILALAILCGGDYLVIRLRIWRNRDPFGTVQIERYTAVHEKNGKTEFTFDQPETATCIHSLFPHLGYAPCWYLNRHKEKRMDI